MQSIVNFKYNILLFWSS